MKLPLSFIAFAIAGIFVPAAMAGQRGEGMEGQKARPDPAVLDPAVLHMPPQNVPVMIAQANQTQPSDITTVRTLGVCQIIPNGASATPSLDYVVSPKVSAGSYLYQYEKQAYEQQKIATSPAAFTILQQPKHGILRLATEADHFGTGIFDPASGLYAYLPEKGYFGNDSAIMLVDVGGIKVKVVYFFQTVDLAGIGEGLDEALCKKGTQWKISSTLDANGNSTITSVEYQSPATSTASALDIAALASTLGSSVLSNLAGDTATVNLNIADLAGGALGQATGTSITLDTTASGYGWFIDTTPALNEEWLPTSNPNEWVAKAGSAAAGKMDMLTVLLHEYGHALGIDHSAESRGQVLPFSPIEVSFNSGAYGMKKLATTLD